VIVAGLALEFNAKPVVHANHRRLPSCRVRGRFPTRRYPV